MKKTLTTLLILLLAAAALTGCGKKNAGYDISPEFVIEAVDPDEPATTEDIADASVEPPTVDVADDPDNDPGGIAFTEDFIVELEEGQALGGG